MLNLTDCIRDNVAVQPLTDGKIIIKSDGVVSSPKIPKKGTKKITETNIYEEPYINKTGNIDIDELATSITAKMLGGQVKIPETKAIEVDIKREIAIGKVKDDAVKSEVIEGKVNNKLSKLRELRKKNGS